MNKYRLFTIKRYLEQLLMFPFILIGKCIGVFFKPSAKYQFFFFLPIYGVGGAEYINAKILASVKHKRILLVFTRKSKEKSTLHLFKHENVTIIDISRWTDNKYLYFCNFICRGFFAYIINSAEQKPLVFNAQCNFAYKLLPHLNGKIKIIELIHLFDEVFCNVWMPFVSFLNVRLSFSYIEIDKINSFAKKAGVPISHYDKFIRLTPFVDIPNSFKKEPKNDEYLNVYYAGRGTNQKRLWLNFEIARRVKKLNLPINFFYVGNFQNELPNDILEIASFTPSINTGNDMYNFIKDKDVLLLTSESEGFPVALLEAMHFGIVPVVTPVGEMKNAIEHNKNGILLNNNSEEDVILSAIEALTELSNSPNHYSKLSRNIRETYEKEYPKSKFDQEMMEIFK